MTKTINVTQEILDSLSSGAHTLKIVATTASGFSAYDTATFSSVSNPEISLLGSQGEHGSAFDFPITLSNINNTATLQGYLDGSMFYQLNFATDGTYTVFVPDGTVSVLAGGSHQITFVLTDEKNKSASASTTFTKTYTKPVVSVASNMGDKIASFAIPFTIKNAKSEHPSLVAYMDSTTDIIFQTNDASNISSVTVNLNGLTSGSHTVILAVTNYAGTTTKNVSFNKAVYDGSTQALKLGYQDDTWDANTVEDRIYTETIVRYEGVNYKSYEDMTPYVTEGDVVTGGLLAALSRGIQNAGASNLIRNSDGTYTETSANGVSVITPTDDGYTEVFTDKENNVLTKNVFFNPDGSVAESTSFERATE